MKINIKSVLIGLLIGIIVSGTSVLALTGAVQKTLDYNNIKIVLNGQELIPTNANGEYVEPFTIEGTTYLPVRAIASALGLEVGWDEATATVSLSENADDPTEEIPAETPAEEDNTPTLGNVLLEAFNGCAESGNALSVAEDLVTNPAIKFSGAAIAVEEGFLTGFDDTEITGFKEGAMFAPMIGTIPFIGYVFELEDENNIPAFIENLESNANLRWNICTTADEMHTGSAGNKVFFIMCPTTLAE